MSADTSYARYANTPFTAMAAQRGAVKTTYALERTIQPIYSGGSISLSEDGRIFAACLGEDAMLTDLHNGRELGRIEGVRIQSSFCVTHLFSSLILLQD